MDEKKAREHRRREICRQFRLSGLTRKAFCEKTGIGLSTLGFWLRKERTEKAKSSDDKMVPVGSVTPSELRHTLRIRVKEDIVIELDLPASEQEIRTVLRSVTES
jgi:hypothetical protein